MTAENIDVSIEGDVLTIKGQLLPGRPTLLAEWIGVYALSRSGLMWVVPGGHSSDSGGRHL